MGLFIAKEANKKNINLNKEINHKRTKRIFNNSKDKVSKEYISVKAKLIIAFIIMALFPMILVGYKRGVVSLKRT